MHKPTPFLWFDGNVGEAAKFYRSIFKKSKIVRRNGLAHNLQSATLLINGQELILFNGGPHFKLTPAFSLLVQCKTQREIDYFWKKLTQGGEESHCGWLIDRYGLSWQIVPEILFSLLSDKDQAKSDRAMQAMMQMRKFDLKAMLRAHAGK